MESARSTLVLVVAGVLAGLWTGGLVLSAPAANATEWPRRLFIVYESPQASHSTSANPVRDVAQAQDGVLFATGDALGPGASVSLLTPSGRVRRLAHFDWGGPSGGYGGGTAIGIGADRDGGALVVQGWNNRLVRVSRSGRQAVLAGTGRGAFSGDGGPAVSAEISPGNGNLNGVVRTADGSIVFTDTWNNRLRRVRPDGLIETIAGLGPSVNPFGFSCAPLGDGGPAAAAGLCYPSDVLAASDGGLVLSDTANNRIRRLTADGTISTIAGTGRPFDPSGAPEEGQPATEVAVNRPQGISQLPNGDIVYTSSDDIDRIAPDGSWHPLLRNLSATRDYAGRSVGDGGTPTGIAATREGGLLIAARNIYYLAPPRTRRTLIAIRGSRVSDRKVTVRVDASRRARATLQVRLGRRIIAQSTRDIRAGRRRLRLHGPFATRQHDVRVTLRSAGGAIARDQLRLYLGGRLAMSYVRDLAVDYEDESRLRECHRITRLRIDCSYRYETLSFKLKATGLISVRARLTNTDD